MEISLNGTAFKYTNFFFGFQERYFKLNGGVIYYYLSKETEKEGCRKFRVLSNFRLELDDDPFRFDIVFPDERWSLRFCNREELVLWRDALQAFSKYPLEVVEELRLMSTTSSNSTQSSFFAVECDVPEQLSSGTSILDPNTLYRLRDEMPEQLSSVIKVLDCCLKPGEINPPVKSSADLETAIEKCHQLTKNLQQAKFVLRTISSEGNGYQDQQRQANGTLPQFSHATGKEKSGWGATILAVPTQTFGMQRKGHFGGWLYSDHTGSKAQWSWSKSS